MFNGSLNDIIKSSIDMKLDKTLKDMHRYGRLNNHKEDITYDNVENISIEDIRERVEHIVNVIGKKDTDDIDSSKLYEINKECNEKISEIESKLEIDEKIIKRKLNKFKNRSNHSVKVDIDNIYLKILECDKKINELEKSLNEEVEIDNKEYVVTDTNSERIEKIKNEKLKLEEEFKNKVDEFLDNIEEKSDIVRNIYLILNSIK